MIDARSYLVHRRTTMGDHYHRVCASSATSLTLTLTASAGALVQSAGFMTSTSRLRAAASLTSWTGLSHGPAGAALLAEHVKSSFPGWRSKLKRALGSSRHRAELVAPRAKSTRDSEFMVGLNVTTGSTAPEGPSRPLGRVPLR